MDYNENNDEVLYNNENDYNNNENDEVLYPFRHLMSELEGIQNNFLTLFLQFLI